MRWKNYGLIKAKNKDAEHFTTDFGIKIRRIMHPILKFVIKMNTGKETILVSYPKLEKNKAYIFTAGHSFPGEIGTNLATIDRATYTLIGTTDQVDHNPQMYFLWLNGMIYVAKLNDSSRKESFKKMVRVLNNDSSVMLFPEGVLNNTENLNCVSLYPGFYHLAVQTNKEIVPIVSNYDYEHNAVLVAAANPIDISKMTKDEAKVLLRETIATLRYNLSRMTIEQARSLKRVLSPEEFSQLNPDIKVELKRESLTGDIHAQYMELRKKIYNEVKWGSKDAFDEEIMSYKEKDITTFDEVYDFLDKIDLSNKSNETREILGPVLRRRLENKKYDFKEYMKNNFDK